MASGASRELPAASDRHTSEERMTERFEGVVRLEPAGGRLRRFLASSPDPHAPPGPRRVYAEVDEGELVVDDDGFNFTGRKGQLLGHHVREVSATESVPVTDRVYEIKYGDDPLNPSKELFTTGRSNRPRPGLRDRLHAALAVTEQDVPLLVALNRLLPSVPLSLAQYERIDFPSQCVCCLAPATESRLCLDPSGESYSFILRLDASRVMTHEAPAMNVPYCESHLLGFDACMEIERSWQAVLESWFWRRWNESETADPRLRDSRPYVNPYSTPRFGPASDSHTRCWLGLRLDWIVTDTEASAWDKEEGAVSIVLRFQNPVYTSLFLRLNQAR